MRREVIAIDQDPVGKQARRVHVDGQAEYWLRPLANGATAVGIFNRGDAATTTHIQWSQLNLTKARVVRDLWAHKDVPDTADGFTGSVPRHGVRLLRISPVSPQRDSLR